VKLSRTCHVSFCQISPLMTCPEGSRSIRMERQITPLKIRGVRGVMEITPFIPLTLRGRFKERILILRGRFKERPLIFELKKS